NRRGYDGEESGRQAPGHLDRSSLAATEPASPHKWPSRISLYKHYERNDWGLRYIFCQMPNFPLKSILQGWGQIACRTRLRGRLGIPEDPRLTTPRPEVLLLGSGIRGSLSFDALESRGISSH